MKAVAGALVCLGCAAQGAHSFITPSALPSTALQASAGLRRRVDAVRMMEGAAVAAAGAAVTDALSSLQEVSLVALMAEERDGQC